MILWKKKQYNINIFVVWAMNLSCTKETSVSFGNCGFILHAEIRWFGIRHSNYVHFAQYFYYVYQYIVYENK